MKENSKICWTRCVCAEIDITVSTQRNAKLDEARSRAEELKTIEDIQIEKDINCTWKTDSGRVLVFFIISAPNSLHELYTLQKEQKRHNDLIVTDLIESYENLVFKVYASIVFHQQYCPMAQYLMKIDDDVSIHLDRMIHFWKVDDRANTSIFCQIWTRSQPIRDPGSKWYVPHYVWPEKYYPRYCNGPMYVMGKKAGQRLLDHAQVFPPLTIEDIFFTGIIAEVADVRRNSWSRSMLSNTKDFWREHPKCVMGEPVIFAVHSLPTPDALRRGFQHMKKYKCSTIGEVPTST